MVIRDLLITIVNDVLYEMFCNWAPNTFQEEIISINRNYSEKHNFDEYFYKI